jgi:hypothetical protein
MKKEEFYVFTEAFNCGKILSVCLDSYHKHHDYPIHIIGTSRDFDDAGPIINHRNNILINWDKNEIAKDGWSTGHRGTAVSFATAMRNEYKFVVHIDSDCYFKGECLSETFDLLKSGYDIVGTPRPYKNNLSGVKGLDNTPDTVSTYFMGVNTEKIPSSIDFNMLVNMCGGWHSYTGDRVLDFFDPVTHSIIRSGGKIYFLDTKKYGGIDLNGSKINGYDTNLNFDCGDLVVHFGGVGTGKAVENKLSNPPKGYSEWAYYRWNFYSHIFFGTVINQSMATVYSNMDDHSGKRWCNGCADDKIINACKKDIGI